MKRVVNGREVELEPTGAEISKLQDRLAVRTSDGVYSALAVRADGKTFVSYRGRSYTAEPVGQSHAAGASGSGEVMSPMPGLIVDVLVSVGDKVVKGQKLAILEAMKTQQPMTAPFDGSVTEVKVAKGEQVDAGKLMVKVAAS